MFKRTKKAGEFKIMLKKICARQVLAAAGLAGQGQPGENEYGNKLASIIFSQRNILINLYRIYHG